MTPEQHREYAIKVAQVFDQITRGLTHDDRNAIADVIRTDLTWPDPCPACGVVGCTEHPTWAAEKAGPEQHYRKVFRMGERTVDTAAGEANLYAFEPVECAETPATTNTLVTGWPEPIAVEYEHLDLTPAQEIRLRLTEAALTGYADGTYTADGVAADVMAMVLPLAQMVETGQSDDLEDACTERCPGREMHEPAEVQRWKSAYLTSQEAAALAKMRLVQIEDLWADRHDGGPAAPSFVYAHDLRACLDWVPEAAGTTRWFLGDQDVTAQVHREPDLLRAVSPMARWVGERGPEIWDTSKSLAENLAAPKPAGYAQTFNVVTAQDPGGLLSAPVPVYEGPEESMLGPRGRWIRDPEPKFVPDEPETAGASAQEAPEPSDPHSGTPEGSTGLTAPPRTPATAIPADGESGDVIADHREDGSGYWFCVQCGTQCRSDNPCDHCADANAESGETP